jgi:uncharacterized coiled-coil protein SlyX
MNDRIQLIEENIALLQNDLSDLSSESYRQQKEILELKLQIKKLKNDLEKYQQEDRSSAGTGSSIPPHY